MSGIYQSNSIEMKLKVCGMKHEDNIQSIAELQPDYMGFIFYPKSKRNFENHIPKLSKDIKKTGVFVNMPVAEIIEKIQQYDLQAVQLHGDESVEIVKELKSEKPNIEIIKVFGIKDEFEFSILEDYADKVDYFLFDTKGKERGGNGVKFDWSVLKKYHLKTPFILSGGISPDDIDAIKEITKSGLPIYGLDINSKFEIEPGLKHIEAVKGFKNNLNEL